LHDAIIAERLGVPAVAVMTSQFLSAANLMAKALGARDYALLEIEHPISSASDIDLAARAGLALPRGVDILLGAAG
jgi:hypothetical protein